MIIKKGINYLKDHGLKDTVNMIIFKYFKKYLNIFFSKFNKIKNIDKKDTFKKITIDTTYFYSDLCEISKNYKTDKSPYNPKHRHSYTGIYHFLFHKIKNYNLNIAEIGCYKNEGMKMFREYFKNSNLYGYDIGQKYIDSAKKDDLKNTFYFLMDAGNNENIQNGLSKCPEKFDIIIDDSSHIFDHQIKIIRNSVFFLKDGAYLIIEDIFNNRKEHSEKNYFQSLSSVKKYFSEIYFIQSKHINNFSPLYDNDKILVLVRNDVN
tara:strand:- start:1254 stop:2045 length:792 start_codon:yes stop_codon:yes gene_type:complete